MKKLLSIQYFPIPSTYEYSQQRYDELPRVIHNDSDKLSRKTFILPESLFSAVEKSF